MKAIVAFALLVTASSAAMAQITTTKGKPPLTEPQARYIAMNKGYSNTSSIKKDAKGDWVGSGTGGNFMVKPDGSLVKTN